MANHENKAASENPATPMERIASQEKIRYHRDTNKGENKDEPKDGSSMS